ncbi:putative adipose-regulatory protein-domain-containing protein [Panaeolus papilionaceus]|nr:putative adipose-regulatory protein-domain-containing protein [Panaeolus papilionaceus]
MSSSKDFNVVTPPSVKPRTNFIHSLVSTGIATIRPYAPQLIPFLICTIFIPFVVLLSISAGWFVWNSLSVSWEIPLHLQYGDGTPPYAHFELPWIIPHQRYDVSVCLNVPITESNLALGNFMASLSLETLSNKTVAQVRRAAIATPRPHSLPFFSNKKNTEIKVSLLNSFTPTTSQLVGRVEIGRRDHWRTLGTGEGRELSVISASLRGLAVPHGIRGLAIQFPLTASIIASGLFFVILSTILGGCILPLVIPKHPNNSHTLAKWEPRKQREPDYDISTPRERSTEREIKTETDEIKTEESELSDPPTLRKRPSRPYLDTSDSDA